MGWWGYGAAGRGARWVDGRGNLFEDRLLLTGSYAWMSREFASSSQLQQEAARRGLQLSPIQSHTDYARSYVEAHLFVKYVKDKDVIYWNYLYPNWFSELSDCLHLNCIWFFCIILWWFSLSPFPYPWSLPFSLLFLSSSKDWQVGERWSTWWEEVEGAPWTG